MDPTGYEEGATLHADYALLTPSGAYIAATMGWLSNVKDGSGTAFIYPYNWVSLEPVEGSIAFWSNLASCHRKEHHL